MIIRSATVQDAKAINIINILCWKKNYKDLIASKFLSLLSVSKTSIQHFEEDIQKKELYLVAEEQGKILGYLGASRIKDKASPYSFEINYLYVHPKHQGKGIGSLLWKTFQKNANKSPFYLYMIKGNLQAQKFYLKKGGIHQKELDKTKVARGISLEEEFFSFKF